MTDLAKLVVRLEAETARYQRELDGARKKLSRFERTSNEALKKVAKGFGVMAAGAAVGLVAMTRQALNTADATAKMAQRVGVSTEALSQLQFAAELSDVSVGDLNTGLNRFNRTVDDAAQGTQTAVDAFARMGVSLKNTDGELKSTEKLLGELADQFAAMPDNATKAALAQELFGRSGAQLIPLLNNGAAGIAELRAEADRLGLTIRGDVAAAAEQFNDNLVRLRRVGTGAATELAGALAPSLAVLTDKLVDVVNGSRDGSDGIRELQIRIASTIGPVLSLADRLNTLGKGFAAITAPGRAMLRAAGESPLEILKSLRSELSRPAAGATFVDDVIAKLDELDAIARKRSTAGTGGDPTGGGDGGAGAAGAVNDQLQQMLANLQQQIATFDQAESAVLKYRLSVGDLAPQVAALGEQGTALAGSIIEQAAALEQLQSQAEQQQKLQAIYEANIGVITGVDDATRAYRNTLDQLQTLMAAEIITFEEFNAAQQRVTENFENGSEPADRWGDQLAAIADQAARNMQTAFADFLFNPFDQRMGGMVKSFANALQRMAAEQAASRVFKLLGDAADEGGALGAIGSALGFGGNRANGGRVLPGRAYEVGEIDREWFIPDSAGQIVTERDMAGAGRVSQVFNITTPNADSFRKSQRQIARDARRGMGQ